MKTILLTQGKETVVDDDVYFKLINRSVYYNNGYAKISMGKTEKVYLHRYILGLRECEECDHRDNDKLNNLRSNLRIVTRSQQRMNTPKSRGSGNKFKGVSWHKLRHKWISTITIADKHIHLGYYDSQVEAAKRYNEVAKVLFGEYARLNGVEGIEGTE